MTDEQLTAWMAVYRKDGLYEVFKHIYQAGRRAGAEDMRERAAKEVNLETGMRHMSEKVRALPIKE